MLKYFNVVKRLLLIFLVLSLVNCSKDKDDTTTPPDTRVLKILALGDSYTKGESVCSTCNFPTQVRDSINARRGNGLSEVQIIAQIGWTTPQLKNAINQTNPPNTFDLVTLLIGVNNQYQNMPFSFYENDFPELVQKAIEKAGGNRNKVVVLSIPDYAFTPFGNGNTSISAALQTYNQFASDYCASQQISFVYITDITQLGLQQPALVAQDGLHPSTLAYTRFVERLLPVVMPKLGL